MEAKFDLKPGSYIVAVSGGVDSVVLLYALWSSYRLSATDYQLVVAHFDHGIRGDSKLDRLFVEALAQEHGLQFVYAEGHLGTECSEARARTARYEFLQKVAKQNEALGIILAHHQDDLLETAILNMLRGTGRKGLTALSNRDNLIRPLLNVPKQAILDYAALHQIEWREDSTNSDTRYLRNHVRLNLIPKFSDSDKAKLITIINDLRVSNMEIDELVADFIAKNIEADVIVRKLFNSLPVEVAKEVMASWLRTNEVTNMDGLMISRLVEGCKMLTTGKQMDVDKNHYLKVNRTTLALAQRER